MNQAFDSYLNMLQTSIRNLDMVSAHRFLKNVKAFIHNALALIVVAGDVQLAADKLFPLAEQLVRKVSAIPPADVVCEKAELIELVDQLRLEMRKCETSGLGRLGE